MKTARSAGSVKVADTVSVPIRSGKDMPDAPAQSTVPSKTPRLKLPSSTGNDGDTATAGRSTDATVTVAPRVTVPVEPDEIEVFSIRKAPSVVAVSSTSTERSAPRA